MVFLMTSRRYYAYKYRSRIEPWREFLAWAFTSMIGIAELVARAE